MWNIDTTFQSVKNSQETVFGEHNEGQGFWDMAEKMRGRSCLGYFSGLFFFFFNSSGTWLGWLVYF